MSNEIVRSNPRAMSLRPARPSSREDYFAKRRPDNLHGRLGFGGQTPRLVGCEVFELSEKWAYVESYILIDNPPKMFTLEIDGQYHRARLCYAEGLRLRLELFFEELHYIDIDPA
jgi:hypothetical protein